MLAKISADISAGVPSYISSEILARIPLWKPPAFCPGILSEIIVRTHPEDFAGILCRYSPGIPSKATLEIS